MRRECDWVQIVSFNPSRFDDVYEPRRCFEFLSMPGDPSGGFLVHPLRHPNGTQRWVKAARIADPASNDSAETVFAEMVRQFKPSLVKPLNLQEVRNLLEASIDYWPHAYALCVMAAEAGDKAAADRYFRAFQAVTADKPFSWVQSRKEELMECLTEIGSARLADRIAQTQAEKLRNLKLAA